MDTNILLGIDAVYRGKAAFDRARADLSGLEGGAEGASGKLKKAFGVASIGAIAVAGGLTAVASAGKAAWDVLNEGAEIELAATRFDRLAQSIHSSRDAMLNDLRGATRGMMSDLELTASASDILSLRLASTQEEVTRMATVIGGLNWDMQQVVLTFANMSTMRLDALGLSVSDVTGRAEKMRNAGMDAQQAFKMAVIEAGEDKMRLFGSTADTTAGRIKILTATWENAVTAFKMEFAQAASSQLETIAEKASEMGPAMAEGLGRAGKGVGDAWGNALSFVASAALEGSLSDLEKQLLQVGVAKEQLDEMWADSGMVPFLLEQDTVARLEQQYELMQAYKELLAETFAQMPGMQDAIGADQAMMVRQYQLAADAQEQNVEALDEAAIAAREQAFYASEMADYYWRIGQFAGDDNAYARAQAAAAALEVAEREEEALQRRIELMEAYAATAAEGGAAMQGMIQGDDAMFSVPMKVDGDLAVNMDMVATAMLNAGTAAGASAFQMGSLGVALGELTPQAAEAYAKTIVLQEAIEVLATSWKLGGLDTTEFLSSVDGVIQELQTKELGEIQVDLVAKTRPMASERDMLLPEEDRTIPIHADLTPAENALQQAMGMVAGIPEASRTVQMLADFDAITTAASTTIPSAIRDIPEESRTVEVLASTAAVDSYIEYIRGVDLDIRVDFVTGAMPEFPEKAGGGRVGGQRGYIVGEHGPELFVPDSGGRITSANAFQQGGGGAGDLVMNFFFNAPVNRADARSVGREVGDEVMRALRMEGLHV